MTKKSLKWPLKIIISISWIIVGIYPKYEKCTLKNTYMRVVYTVRWKQKRPFVACPYPPPPPQEVTKDFCVLYIAAF